VQAWKVNGYRTEREGGEKSSDDRRRKAADEEIRAYETPRNQARRAGPKFSYRPPDIVSVSYQSAMLRTVADAERVPVYKFSAPDIPSEVLEAIRSERGEALGGAHGDPSWGEPIQFDRVVIEQPQRTTDIRVYNRAIQLFMKDSEMVRRVHRLCETVRKACEGPG